MKPTTLRYQARGMLAIHQPTREIKVRTAPVDLADERGLLMEDM